MGLVSDFKRWREYRHFMDTIESEGRVYDVRITLLKAGKALLISGLAVVAAALLAYLADPTAVTQSLSGSLSPALIGVLVPLITAMAHAGQNYLKNKD